MGADPNRFAGIAPARDIGRGDASGAQRVAALPGGTEPARGRGDPRLASTTSVVRSVVGLALGGERPQGRARGGVTASAWGRAPSRREGGSNSTDPPWMPNGILPVASSGGRAFEGRPVDPTAGYDRPVRPATRHVWRLGVWDDSKARRAAFSRLAWRKNKRMTR